MTMLLRQSSAVTVSFGPALLNTDGVTLVTNLTGTGSNQTENTSTGIRISKNGGAFAARHAAAGASTYDAFGNYLVPLDTTDTNTLGTLRMQYANAAAFCPIFQDFMVINTALWDALCASSGGAIPNAVAGATNGLFIAGTNAATAITTGLTTHFIGTVDTVTTYTGNTPQTADVAALITTVGAAGAGLTAVGLATTSRPGIRKNTALATFEFLMTDSTNHNPVTGLTVTVTRSIDGGAFAAGTIANVAEVSNGIYKFDFGAGDLNGNVITVRCTATAADDLFFTIKTSP